MSQVSELRIPEIKNVDYDRLTAPQVASLAISLGIFNDAHEECARLETGFLARVASTVSCGVVAIALLLWSASMQAALVAVMVTLGVGGALAGWRFRRAQKCLKSASASLKDEIVQLPT